MGGVLKRMAKDNCPTLVSKSEAPYPMLYFSTFDPEPCFKFCSEPKKLKDLIPWCAHVPPLRIQGRTSSHGALSLYRFRDLFQHWFNHL